MKNKNLQTLENIPTYMMTFVTAVISYNYKYTYTKYIWCGSLKLSFSHNITQYKVSVK